MKPAPFDYVQASSIEEALSLLDDDARPIAGGQTFGPLLNLRLAQPARLVDISRIESLRAVFEDTERTSLGACMTHAEIEDGRTGDAANGLLAHVARGIAYRSVRNRGTIGGSLSYADPAAEWPTVMCALGARIEARGPRGNRTLAIDGFLDGPMSTALEPDELLVTVHVPHLGRAARWGFHKRCRRPGDFAEALAVVIKDRTSTVTLGATPIGPVVMASCAECVHGLSEWGPDAERALRDAFDSDVSDAGVELDDYERQVQHATLMRAVEATLVQ